MLIQKNQDNPIVNLGMFNLVRGVAVAVIVLEHTLYENFSVQLTAVSAYAMYLIHNALIPMFLIVSGYGFRKSKLRRGIPNQIDSLLIPVLVGGAATVLLAFATRAYLGHSLPYGVKVAAQYAGGILLGLSYDLRINGVLICYGMGTSWYLWTLFLCWLLLNLLVIYVPKKWLPAGVAVLMLIGRGVGEFVALPYCILPALIGTGYYFLGWQMKVRKSLQDRPRPWPALLVILLALGSGLIGRFNLATCEWTYGIVDIIAAGAAGLLLTWAGVYASAYEFPMKGALQWLGRNSLYIVVLHTVEDHGIPWYSITEKLCGLGLSAGLTYWLLIAAKIGIIAACYRPFQLALKCFLIEKIKFRFASSR